MMTATPAPEPLSDAEFEQLEAILDDLGERSAGIPKTWEYCDGFITALVCCRRLIAPSAYFPAVFAGDGEAQADFGFGAARFRDEAQLQTFLQLWARRCNEIAAALDAEVDDAADDGALHPYVIDVRSAWAQLPDGARAEAEAALGDAPLPAFAQMWALGFMDVVQTCPDDWRAPRDRELRQVWEAALADVAALLEDDTDSPALNPISDDGPPTVSERRMEQFFAAIAAAYDLRAIGRELGEPVATVRKPPTPGRNDPCPCGSGRKFKHCHGGAA